MGESHMEELNARYMQCIKSFDQLQYTATSFEKIVAHKKLQEYEDDDTLALYSDALSYRFSFCYELTWRFLKTLLRDHYDIEVANPRSTFQESHLQKIITKEESVMLLRMAQSRNVIAHVYDEERAIEVSKSILIYVQTLVTLSEKLKNFVQ